MKKILKMLLLVFSLSIIYVYTLGIENMPNNIVLFEGEEVFVKSLLGLNIKTINNQTIETVSNNGNQLENTVEKKKIEVSILGKIKVKDIDVDVLPKTTVIPVGNIAGVKLYTNGVLVVGMSEIEGSDNKKYKPYENTGIAEGDTIIKKIGRAHV